MARTSAGKVSQHRFSEIPKAEIQRSSFNRSCGTKTTFDAGYLVPIFVDEALPGDTFKMRASIFARMATLVEPILDNMYLDVFFFAVPNRLLWDNWEKFNGAQDNPGDSTDFLIPTMTAPGAGYNPKSLQDYLGIPILVADLEHSALFTRAYALIYNEWFRDQNLVNSIPFDTDDGPDTYTDYVLQKRGKRHDYATSCLPWPQKGDSVDLPLGTSAPGTIDAAQVFDVTGKAANITVDGTGSGSNQTVVFTANALAVSAASGNVRWNTPSLETDIAGATLTVDLSSATAATINSLRQAFQIQRLLERDARGGTRYAEILKAHFGVTSPDQRLQRPEYLGGGTLPIGVNPVPNTTSVSHGNLAAFSVAQGSGIGFTKSFVEHSIVLGLVSARADLTYQTGLDRMFSRSTRYDFYWPALAHLGEQAVLNKEIYAEGSAVVPWDDNVFGYQERYAEYRYKQTIITGRMRSLSPVTYDVWHLSQELVSPVLNQAFIEEDPPMARVLLAPSSDHFFFDSFFDYKCVRPMPTYSVPGLIDHF